MSAATEKNKSHKNIYSIRRAPFLGVPLSPMFDLKAAGFLLALIAVFGAPYIHFLYGPGISPYLFAVVSFAFIVFLVRPSVNVRGLRYIIILILPLQILTFFSFAYDSAFGATDATSILSALRPTALGFYLIVVLYLLPRIFRDAPHLFFRVLALFLIPVYVFALLYDVLHVPSARDILQYLYVEAHRIDRVEDRFVTFFGTTYWAGFVYFVLFCFFAALSITQMSAAKGAAFHAVVLLILAALTGSRVFFLLPFLSFGLMLILYKLGFGAVFFATIVLVLFSIAILASPHLVPSSIVTTLLESGIYAARVTGRLLESPEHAGSLHIRVEQVIYAATDSNILMPSGLGQGMLLESGYAEILYRTGLFGLFIFHFAAIWLSYRMSQILKMDFNPHRRAAALAVSVVMLTSPFWMLSNSMISYPKTAFAFALAYGAGLSLLVVNRCTTGTSPNS